VVRRDENEYGLWLRYAMLIRVRSGGERTRTIVTRSSTGGFKKKLFP